MKTILSWLLPGLLILDFFCVSTFAADTLAVAPKRKLRMAYTDFPPFLEKTADGPKGLLIDQAKKIVTRAGYDLEFVYVPFKRMPGELSNGNVDIWLGLTHYHEFKSTTFIGNKAVATLELMTYALGQDVQVKNSAALKKYRLVTHSGYSYGGLIDEIHDPKNKYQYIEVKDIDQAYRLLVNKRADVFLNYRANIDTWMKEHPASRLRGRIFKNIPVHFAVSRKALEGNDVLKNLEQAVPTSVADAP